LVEKRIGDVRGGGGALPREITENIVRNASPELTTKIS
jgi:hypothetical protein